MNNKIGIKSLVFMNVSALYGIRWIAKSTASSFGLGLGAIPTWLFFSVLYFIPGALLCAELAAMYKDKTGGLYDWVKEAYGDKYGFMVSWLYWVAKIFWYSSFLTYLSINISYMVNVPSLADNKYFVLILSVSIFWLISIVSTRGISLAKIFTNTGALGSTIPSIILVIMGFVAVLVLGKQEPASTYTVATLTPKLNPDSLVSISAILFGFSGAEVLAPFITQIEKPEKNFPKAILYSALIVAGMYILGSVAITLLLPTEEITASKGLLDAILKGCELLGIPTILMQAVALGVSFSILGCIIIYIVSPLKMLFGSVDEGIFPKSLTRINNVGMPAHAIIIQAVMVTVILVATNLMPSVDAIYNVLVTMTGLVSLFPYMLLYLSYIKIKREKKDLHRPYLMVKNDNLAIWIARFLLLVMVFGIICSAMPVMPTFKENIIYEIEMIGGGILIIISGLIILRNYEKKKGNV